MSFLLKVIKTVSRKIAISPEKISHRIQNHKLTSSKLKEVLKELSSEDFKNFVWLSTLKSNSQFNCYTLALLRNINIEEAIFSIRILHDKNLIYGEKSKNQYRIHEAIRIFSEQLLTSKKSKNLSIQRLGIKWIDAHQQIILLLQRENNEIKLEKDIYFIKNFYWHLKEAQWELKIDSIIRNLFPLHQWENILSSIVINSSYGIEELFLKAEEELTLNVQDCPGQCLFLFSKYSLMRNTQRILIQNIPRTWVHRLLLTRHWSPSQALTYIRSLNDSHQKAEAIKAIGQELIHEYTDEILREIDNIKIDSARSKSLASIFHKLSNRDKKTALEYVKTIQCEADRSLCISHITPHIPLTLMQQTYLLIEELEEEIEQAKVLDAFLNHCTKPFKGQCLNLIQNYQDNYLKIRLFNQLCPTFPELKSEIIKLLPTIKPDYSTTSIQWQLIEPQNRSIKTIKTWLQGEMSDLDKILFFCERVSEANSEQINELWEIISHPDKWAQTTGCQSTDGNEAPWANAVIGCISYLSTQQIKTLVSGISNIRSPEIKGELCLQLLPFIENQEDYYTIYQQIQSILNLGLRLKYLSQALDYIPETKAEVMKSVEDITDNITRIEIQIQLLERDPDISAEFLTCVKALKSDTHRFHFLRQTLDLISEQEVLNTIDLILSLSNVNHRTELLNRVEKRLSEDEIHLLIRRINAITYPSSQFENAAKQIYRNYWESGLEDSKLNLPAELLAQLPQTQKQSLACTQQVLSEIFSIADPVSQSKVLSLYLKEIQWRHLDPDSLLTILKILSKGDALEFIQIFPTLIQGITKVTGAQQLPRYGNLCEQLSSSQNCSTQSKAQNKAHIYRKVESPESWKEIA